MLPGFNNNEGTAQSVYKLESSNRRTAGPPVRFCSSLLFLFHFIGVCFLQITTQPNPNPSPQPCNSYPPTPGYPEANRVRIPRVFSVKATRVAAAGQGLKCMPCVCLASLAAGAGIPVFFQRDGTFNKSFVHLSFCLLYTSPSPRDGLLSRMPSSA